MWVVEKFVNIKKPLELVAVTCGGLICGVPAVLTVFGYFLFAERGTKAFSAKTTDEDVEAFCSSTSALAITSVQVSEGNNLITKRALDAIGQLFWVTKVSITKAKNFDGAWQEGM